MNYKNWLVAIEDHTITVTLNRNDTMNNLTIDTLRELQDIAVYLDGRDDIWVVILQGDGDHFSSGMDLAVFTEGLETAQEEIDRIIKDQQECLDTFESLRKVTIAKIHGFCIGGGLMLSLCCDFRIASKRTIFSLPEARLGLPILWGTKRVVDTLGVPKAKEMIMLAKRYRAEEALRMGLIHQVVNPDNLNPYVDEFAKKFYRLPPKTLGAVKSIINQSVGTSLEQSQAFEIEQLNQILGSDDIREAVESYTAQRKPDFQGT